MSRIRIEELPEQAMALVSARVALGGLPAFFGRAATAVEQAVQEAGGVVTGPLVGWFHPMPGAAAAVSAGFAVRGVPFGSLAPDVEVVRRPGGLTAVALHVGPYDTLEQTHRELGVWITGRQLDVAEDWWEEYVSDPAADPDPQAWETRVVRRLV